MALYMLHTDTVTALMQGKSKTLDRRIEASEPQELCISAITRGELLCALPKSSSRGEDRESELYAMVRKTMGEGKIESLRNHVHSLLMSLTPEDAKVLRQRFGFDRTPTLAVVEREFARARERVRALDSPDNLWVVLDQFLMRVQCLPWDADAATHFAQIAVDQHSAGVGMGSLDKLIAGHAIAVGAVLVCANERRFARVAGLTTENWTRR